MCFAENIEVLRLKHNKSKSNSTHLYSSMNSQKKMCFYNNRKYFFNMKCVFIR